MSAAGKISLLANKTKGKKTTSTPSMKQQQPLIKNKARKSNLATFPKNPMREIYNHAGWKKKDFHDCLYKYPDYGSKVINSYC